MFTELKFQTWHLGLVELICAVAFEFVHMFIYHLIWHSNNWIIKHEQRIHNPIQWSYPRHLQLLWPGVPGLNIISPVSMGILSI